MSDLMDIDADNLELLFLHVPKELAPKIEAKAKQWELSIQETIIRILKERLEQKK